MEYLLLGILVAGLSLQAAGIYVEKGNPYSLGQLDVSTLTVTKNGDGSPLHTALYFPSKADEYTVIFYVGGLNGYVLVEWYAEYLKMLAAHGFFVVGVDYIFPVYPYTNDDHLKQDISKFFDEIDFKGIVYSIQAVGEEGLLAYCDLMPFELKTFLKDNPQLHGSTPFWNKTGLLCHSSGCDVTLRMIRQHSELFNSTVFLEPFSIDAKQPIKNIIPAFMYGAELSSQGHKCSEPGFDYDQFYSIWKCPRIVVEAADFGHCDFLDQLEWEACHVLNACKTTNDSRLAEYRKFIQGATVSFFITELQGRPDAIGYIADESKVPLKLVEDKSDLNC